MSPWLPYLGGGGDRSPTCVSNAYRKIINGTLKRYPSSKKPNVEVLLINGESKLKNHSTGSVLRLFCSLSNDRGISSS